MKIVSAAEAVSVIRSGDRVFVHTAVTHLHTEGPAPYVAPELVVTEQGAAYLYGKNLRQRARTLLAIAHPDHRTLLSSTVWWETPHSVPLTIVSFILYCFIVMKQRKGDETKNEIASDRARCGPAPEKSSQSKRLRPDPQA